MKKIVILFLFIFTLIFSSFTFKTTIYAGGWCADNTVTVDKANGFNTILKIKRENPKNDTYTITIKGVTDQPTKGISSDGFLTFNLGKLIPGNYTFSAFINGSTACNGITDGAVFAVPYEGQGGSITVKKGSITFVPSSPTSKDNIFITVINLPEETNYAARLSNKNYAETFAQNSELAPRTFCASSSNNSVSFTTSPLAGGIWDVVVTEKSQDGCNGIAEASIAEGSIVVSDSAFVPPTPTQAPIPPPPCATLTPDGKCIAVNTAIGIISTEPQSFVKSIFSIVLGLAGGIALVLIIIAGYRMMASQGNPEQVTAARDQLISTIVGLLFIIFAFVILQVIGVDILRIPGFGE